MLHSAQQWHSHTHTQPHTQTHREPHSEAIAHVEATSSVESLSFAVVVDIWHLPDKYRLSCYILIYDYIQMRSINMLYANVCVPTTSTGQKLLTACRDFREPEMKDLFEICMMRYVSVRVCVCVGVCRGEFVCVRVCLWVCE